MFGPWRGNQAGLFRFAPCGKRQGCPVVAVLRCEMTRAWIARCCGAVYPALLRGALAAAEPRRRKALLASLGALLVATYFWVAGARSAGSPGKFLVWLVLLTLLLWPIFDRFWRRIAIGTVAPLLGAAWGQTSFVTGGGLSAIGARIAALLGRDNRNVFDWRAEGTYRGRDYSVSERRITIGTAQSRAEHSAPDVRYILSAGVAVPVPFRGEVTLTRRAAVFDRLDELLRRIASVDLRQTPVEPAFDAVFTTRASEAAPLDVLLTPAFRRAMLDLAGGEDKRRFSGSFENGRFYLDMRIERRAFAAARLLTPMPRLAQDAEALWWDLTLPHRLIDALMGDHVGRLR